MPGKSNSVVTGPPAEGLRLDRPVLVSPVGDFVVANRKRVTSGETLG